MRAYTVTIGPRDNPRLQFEAMAVDSFACQLQHLDLCKFGERMSVHPKVDPKCDAADLQALREQIQMQGRGWL